MRHKKIRLARQGGVLLVCDLKAHTEIGIQARGIFTNTGSDTPALSLFLTASSYEVPTATILLSSSDSAIQLSSGAARKASNLGSGVAGISVFPLILQATPRFRTRSRLLVTLVDTTGKGRRCHSAAGSTSAAEVYANLDFSHSVIRFMSLRSEASRMILGRKNCASSSGEPFSGMTSRFSARMTRR